MDVNNNEGSGIISLMISISTTVFAWITIKDIQMIATLAATVISSIAGILASLSYIKKIKNDK